MAVFRVPFPSEPERRMAIFEKAVAKLSTHGACDGTPEAGTFHGHTPIGGFAGRYRAPEGADEIEVEITRKPFLIPLSMIEHEARKFVEQHA